MPASGRLAARLRDLGRLEHWAAGGISATHHTAGRIDHDHVQVRRAICWNDHSLAPLPRRGLERLGGDPRVRSLIGGPWAIRYTLSHLVKDEEHLSAADWQRTVRILPHGSLAAGFLTGNFDVVSVSAAASTGIMDLRTNQWCRPMLDALANPEYRDLAWAQLPRIIDQNEPIGPLAPSAGARDGMGDPRPLIFPTSDDQQAGLVGGGAVEAGQVAIVLGNSAVVNSSSASLPQSGTLDAMRLNWGPYLWMRCYNNGAQFLDRIVGDETGLGVVGARRSCLSRRLRRDRRAAVRIPGAVVRCEFAARAVVPFGTGHGRHEVPCVAGGVGVPDRPGRARARGGGTEGIAHLGIRRHRRSDLMCEILATVLDRPLERLQSFEGPALGAAVTALAALESHRRRRGGITEPFTVADAVVKMVKFRTSASPNAAWRDVYRMALIQFEQRIKV